MITIVDYGMGNLRSVQKAFEWLGFPARIAQDPEEVSKAIKLVLPGVGAFGDCMGNLRRLGLVEAIRDFIRSGRPYLGICLGLQILFSESEEFGIQKGLDLIPGRVLRFSEDGGLKIPHMGWNRIWIRREAPILREIPDGSYFYFVHSYYVVPADETAVATTTEYGRTFVSGIWKENLFAFQFHPEKSQTTGLRLLKSFGEL